MIGRTCLLDLPFEIQDALASYLDVVDRISLSKTHPTFDRLGEEVSGLEAYVAVCRKTRAKNRFERFLKAVFGKQTDLKTAELVVACSLVPTSVAAIHLRVINGRRHGPDDARFVKRRYKQEGVFVVVMGNDAIGSVDTERLMTCVEKSLEVEKRLVDDTGPSTFVRSVCTFVSSKALKPEHLPWPKGDCPCCFFHTPYGYLGSTRLLRKYPLIHRAIMETYSDP